MKKYRSSSSWILLGGWSSDCPYIVQFYKVLLPEVEQAAWVLADQECAYLNEVGGMLAFGFSSLQLNAHISNMLSIS